MNVTFRTVPNANMSVAVTASHRFVVERLTKGGFRMITTAFDSGAQVPSEFPTRAAAYKAARSI